MNDYEACTLTYMIRARSLAALPLRYSYPSLTSASRYSPASAWLSLLPSAPPPGRLQRHHHHHHQPVTSDCVDAATSVLTCSRVARHSRVAYSLPWQRRKQTCDRRQALMTGCAVGEEAALPRRRPRGAETAADSCCG